MVNIDDDDAIRKQHLIDQIKTGTRKWSDLSKYSIIELEGILEFDNPQAFIKENDFHSSKQPSYPIEKTSQLNKDLDIAEKLGGRSMRSRIRSTITPGDRVFVAKMSIIEDILNSLPQGYDSVKQDVIDDISKIIEFCVDKQNPLILKIMIAIIENRARIVGMYRNHKALLNHFNVDNKSLFKIRFILIQAGLIKDNKQSRIMTTNIGARNILFDFMRGNEIPNKVMNEAKKNLDTLFLNYPKIYNGREYLAPVALLLSIHLADPNIGLRELCIKYNKLEKGEKGDIIKIYQALKRGMQRSEKFMDDVNSKMKNS